MLPGEAWRVLDPFAACIISIFIMAMAFSLMKPGIDELMEKSLPLSERDEIKSIITSTAGVLGFHHLRTRSMGAKKAIEVHIKLAGDISLHEAHDIATSIEKRIQESLGQDTHIGIHMEPLYSTKKV